jgi:hypothetical protein
VKPACPSGSSLAIGRIARSSGVQARENLSQDHPLVVGDPIKLPDHVGPCLDVDLFGSASAPPTSSAFPAWEGRDPLDCVAWWLRMGRGAGLEIAEIVQATEIELGTLIPH